MNYAKFLTDKITVPIYRITVYDNEVKFVIFPNDLRIRLDNSEINGAVEINIRNLHILSGARFGELEEQCLNINGSNGSRPYYKAVNTKFIHELMCLKVKRAVFEIVKPYILREGFKIYVDFPSTIIDNERLQNIYSVEVIGANGN